MIKRYGWQFIRWEADGRGETFLTRKEKWEKRTFPIQRARSLFLLLFFVFIIFIIAISALLFFLH